MKTKYILWMTLFLMISALSAYTQTLPKGMTVKNDYMPGFGLSLGKIVLVQGKAVIVHYHDKQVGYTAKQDMLLYQKDKIITLDNGRVSFQLNDGSQMSMASNATMTINKSVFDPVKKDRSVFMNMPKGKSRFTVRKLSSFRRSAVKIKTSTAIIGVRGSDFIVKATEQTTEIVTLDDTLLEVNSLFDPSAEAVLIQAYERSEVQSQALPTQPEPVAPEDIDSIMAEFSFSIETASRIKSPVSKTMTEGKSSKQESSEKQKSSDSLQTSEGSDEPKSGDKKSDEPKSDAPKSGGKKSDESDAPKSGNMKSDEPQSDVKVAETTEYKAGETKPAEGQPFVRPGPINNQEVISAPFEEAVFISNDIIEPPEPVEMEISEIMKPPIHIVDDVPVRETPYETIQDVQRDLVEIQTEDEFKARLPGLPAKPK
jgi:hypothetical protein